MGSDAERVTAEFETVLSTRSESKLSGDVSRAVKENVQRIDAKVTYSEKSLAKEVQDLRA